MIFLLRREYYKAVFGSSGCYVILRRVEFCLRVSENIMSIDRGQTVRRTSDIRPEETSLSWTNL